MRRYLMQHVILRFWHWHDHRWERRVAARYYKDDRFDVFDGMS
jgi:hypothetical protein